jgi:hypothetical protein
MVIGSGLVLALARTSAHAVPGLAGIIVVLAVIGLVWLGMRNRS